MKIFPYLEGLNQKREGKGKSYNQILKELDNSIFYIKYKYQKQIYELTNILYNRIDILEDYNQLIIEKSFFAVSHSIDYKNIYDKIKNILEINNCIKEYLSLLNNKKNILEANDRRIILKIKGNNIFHIEKNQKLQNLIKSMKEVEKKEKDILVQYYGDNKDEKKKFLTLFSRIQLHYLYKLIKEQQYDKIRNLFSFHFNNKIISYNCNENLNIGNNNIMIHGTFEGKLRIISNYLFKILNNGLNWNELFIKNKIKEQYKNIYNSQPIYIKSFNNDEYEEEVLNLFYYLTGNLPLFSNLFIFGEETLKQEYLPFLYRVLSTNCLFVMILKICKNGNEDKLLKKIDEIFGNCYNKHYFFLLLYSKKNKNKIDKYIKKYQVFEYKDEISDYKETIKNILKRDVGLVYSDISGAGKTTYIHNLRKMNYNMHYNYFPIKGNYNKDELLNQLKKMEVKENSNNIIHIDLYDTKDENIIKEFLFYFIFFKFYGYDNDIWNYGYYKDIKIKVIIELPNTYKNYFEKYKMLNYIPIEKEISIGKENKIPYLEESSKIIMLIGQSEIQIVSNIINLYNNDKFQDMNLDMNSSQLLKREKCEEIINKTLIYNTKNSIINFYQKINFIQLLSTEFKIFTMCPNLSNFSDEIRNLRKNIMKSIIENSKYIIELDNFEKQLFEINSEIKKDSDREENFEKIMGEIQQKKKKIDYNTIKPNLIGLHSDGNFLSIITSNDNCELLKDINDYINEINLQTNSNLDYIKKSIELNNKELRRELLKIIVDENFIDNGKSKYERIESLLDEKFPDYVFTLDNFVKMVLIFLRIRAGIPTIIMGETGCGKTYLIKMLSLIYRQDDNLFYILKFHAGITDDIIIKFIKDTIEKVKKDEENLINNIYEDINKENFIDNYKINEEKFYEKLWFFQKWFFNSDYKKKYDNYKKEISNKIKKRKIIIFFDEINTSNALGTIKRIICNDNNIRKNLGITDEFVTDKFVIICACNPYRFLSEQNKNLEFGLSMRDQKNRKLVYTVNPLPYSLLNYILYFNDISEEIAIKYIDKMNEKLINENNINRKEFINKLIAKSHYFITKKGDISSVSLREINRFPKIFKFFYKKYFNSYRGLKLNPEELEIRSIIFALYFCYYLRLPTSKMRKDYIKEIINKYIPEFIDVCKSESSFITKKVLGKRIGFAKNRGLCENIFSEFICLLVKEPLIICGKPGSSKSLSIRLLLSAMKGQKSKIEFFKQFPEVIPSFYQCSLTSTSENLEKLFNNARTKLKNRNYEIISLIFIDEMGIADESKNNPLKILHSELDENNEISENDEKLAFIGISNWTLDASKMNRAINIVVEEPDLDYLLITSKEIVRSIDEKIEMKFEKVIYAICEAYLNYLKVQQQKIKEDFHGFRDFYYLIKYIFYNISKIYENDANIDNHLNHIFKGIFRNFGGFIDSSKQKSEEIFKNIFLEKYSHEKLKYEYNILDRIRENIESIIDCRYLLLITDDNNINEILLYYILKDKEYVILSEEDTFQYGNQDNAILNLLLKIEVLMKKEIILILKNLEILYPSLYELFNKNFNEYGSGNKFVKISYEEKQSLIPVNEKFRIIILVQEEKLDFEEKPFLNRFEKQIFSTKNIFAQEELDLMNDYLTILQNYEKDFGFNNMDYINKNLLFSIMIKNEGKGTERKKEKNFFKRLVPLFSQEMIFYLNNNNIKEKSINKEKINMIFKNYYINNYNFKSFLSNINSYIYTIYTCTGINIPLFNKNELPIHNKVLKMEFSLKKTKIILLEEINNIKNIQYLLDDKNYNLYIIKLDENQINCRNDNTLKNFKKFVSDLEKIEKNKDKVVLYIIYKKIKYKKEEKKEIKSNENMMSKIYELFLLYNQVFIENLNKNCLEEDKLYISIRNLIGKREEVIDNENFMENEILADTFKIIKFKIKNEDGYNFEIVNKIQNELKNNKYILDLLKNKIKSIIKGKRIDISKILRNTKNDFIDVLLVFNKTEISIILKNLINYLEDELTLSTILFSNLSKNEQEKNRLYDDFRHLLDNFEENNNYNGIKYIYFGFNLVGLFKDYKKLSMLISNKNSKINIIEEILLKDNSQIKQKLEGSDNEKKFLFNDYILYYISLIIEVEAPKERREKIIIFLNIILKFLLLKLNDNALYLNKHDFIDEIIVKNQGLVEYFEKMCYFLENEREFLSKLLNIFSEFLLIIPDFNDKLISLYKNNIKYNDSVNDKLFIIFNIFLNCIIDESNFSFYFTNNSKEEYLILLQKNKNKFEKILILIGKKYCFPLLNIDIFLYLVKKNDDNLLKITLNFLNNNLDNNDEYLKEEKKIIDNDKILLKIIIKHYKINIKNNIFNIFYSNDNFIKYSLFFFESILGEYFNKKTLKNDFKNIILNIPKDLELNLNQILLIKDNKFIENLIIYFEIIYENFYFKRIEEKEKNKMLKYKEILEKNSLDFVIKNINFYEDNKNNINIQLLCKIAYIKTYFRYFTNIIYDCKNGNEFINFEDLVNNKFYLSAKDISSFKKDINIYILKNLKIRCEENNFQLNSFIYDNNLTFLENYIEEMDKSDSFFFKLGKNIPNGIILKEKFNSDANNKQRFPLLNYCLNEEKKIKYLKNLPIINFISNTMLDIFSYKIKYKEIDSIKLGDEIINIKIHSIELNNNFDNKILEYIKSYNYLLNEENFKDYIIPEDDYKNVPIKEFLVSNNNDNNKLNHILNEFIHLQNKIIVNISQKYFSNKKFEEIEGIDVQEASEKTIPKIISSDDEFLEILINNSIIIENNKGEILFEFDFQEIETELAERIIPGLKRFNIDKIRIIKYDGDKNNEIDEQIINDFKNRYEVQDINQNHKDYIQEFIQKNEEKKDLILFSFQYLMLFILSHPGFKSETTIKEIIDKMAKNKDENEKIELIKSFLRYNSEEDNDDIIDQMNTSDKNQDFKLSELYSIFNELNNN